tara:strand:- start:97 stop:261 length:165 start_codon:yes stop_codon:yes gene_type:complete
MVTAVITIADEMKSLITKFPQNKNQLLADNSFSVFCFGQVIHTFADGSAIKEGL